MGLTVLFDGYVYSIVFMSNECLRIVLGNDDLRMIYGSLLGVLM
jgi:hypothetical protein